MKILIGIPTYSGNINAGLAQDLIKIASDSKAQVDMLYVTRQRVEVARNKLALIACAKNYDYILMIDDDMRVGPQGFLDRMIEADKDITVGGYFIQHEAINEPQLAVYEAEKVVIEGAERFLYKTITKFEGEDQLKEIDAAGTGCMLIKTKVIRKMFAKFGANMFEFWKVKFKKEQMVRGQTLSGLNLGEDITFCERAKKLGFKIYLDNRVATQHSTGQHILAYNKIDE